MQSFPIGTVFAAPCPDTACARSRPQRDHGLGGTTTTATTITTSVNVF